MRRLDPLALNSLCAWIALSACSAPTDAQETAPVALDTSGGSTDASTSPEPASSSSGDEGTSSTTSDSASGSSSAPGSDDSSASSSGEPDACGNSMIEPEQGEECDGPLPGSCADLNPLFTGGDPSCTADCKIDLSGCQACEAPILVPCDDNSTNTLHALELGCDTVEGHDPASAAHLINPIIASPDTNAFRVVKGFGNHAAWNPRGGNRALLLSTGSFAPLGPDGRQKMPAGSAQSGPLNLNGNPGSQHPLPEAMKIRTDKGAPGQPFIDCDGVNDCSNTLYSQWKPSPTAFDILSMTFEVAVPPGTHGYSLDLAYFSAHFPEHNLSTYNDMAIVWSQSESYVGNLAFVRRANSVGPLSVPDLVLAEWMPLDGAVAPELAGTGFDGLKDAPNSQGGASNWLTLEGPATPGETLSMAIAVFDLGDRNIDSVLLLDNWRWRCAPCDLATTCGLRLAD